MASFLKLKLLVAVLLPCLLAQSLAQPLETPEDIADTDLDVKVPLQDLPAEDDALEKELNNNDLPLQDQPAEEDVFSDEDLKIQNNNDPAPFQDEPDQDVNLPEREPESDQNDEASKGEYKPEENLGKKDMLEGDIHLDKSTKEIMHELNNNGRDAVTNPVKHWRGGRVPYVFWGVSGRVQSAWRAAIADYNRYTCIKIVPKSSRDRDYITVVSKGGCYSAIGRSGGRQELSLGRGCEHKGTAIHEIMHALGFFHEQSRRDRDNFITIHWGNIRRGMEYNFKKYRHGQADTLNEPYDYKSVMHYPEYAFSNNRRKTITPRRSGVRLGQRNGFSKIDINQINKLYKCRGGGGGGGGVATPKPPVVGGCKDGYSKCPIWAKYRYCATTHKYGAFMKKHCKKSCGLCGGVVKPRCKDDKAACQSWRRYCNYWRYKKYMSKYCKKTCGKC